MRRGDGDDTPGTLAIVIVALAGFVVLALGAAIFV